MKPQKMSVQWQLELAEALTLGDDGCPRFNGRTEAEVLEDMDAGNYICAAQGPLNWEGKEIMGRRTGRWLFYQSTVLRFEVIYGDDQPLLIHAFNAQGQPDPSQVFEGRWADERSNYAQERAMVVIVLTRLKTAADLSAVVKALADAGAGMILTIKTLRHVLGLGLASTRQLLYAVAPEAQA